MTLRNKRIFAVMLLLGSLCYFQARSLRQVREIAFAMDLVEQGYVEPVDRHVLYATAMKAMLGSLDRYSGFVQKEDFDRMNRIIEQQFGGVGILLEQPSANGPLRVVSPLFNTPAMRAGIQPGDAILEVDGMPTIGWDIDQAISRLTGIAGTPVRLKIERTGFTSPIELELVRAEIETESVQGDRRRDDGSWSFLLEQHPRIGYVKVDSFGSKTADECRVAIESITGKIDGLVLDLRSNPGGLLTAATDICDFFLDDGPIVSTRGRDDWRQSTIEATKGMLLPYRLPIAVLIDGGSASASEVVAACLQDRQRAFVVGERSFGKGSVQNIIPLEGNREAMKLTTARYYPPSGRNIDRKGNDSEETQWGVIPDPGMKVELTQIQRSQWAFLQRNRNIWRNGSMEEPPSPPLVDAVLDRAVEALTNLTK